MKSSSNIMQFVVQKRKLETQCDACVRKRYNADCRSTHSHLDCSFPVLTFAPTWAPTSFRFTSPSCCKQCSEGQHSTQLLQSNVCPGCPKGQYASDNHSPCKICPAGRFSGLRQHEKVVSLRGAYFCYFCPPGKLMLHFGMNVIQDLIP